VQVGQLTKQLSNQKENQFYANTIVNPEKQCKSITTRQRIVIGKGIGNNLNKEEERKR